MIFLLSTVLITACAVAEQKGLSVFEIRETVTRDGVDKVCTKNEEMVQGFRWSVCQGGLMKAIGCAKPGGRKYAFGQTYTDNIAQWICEKDGQNVVLRPISCVFRETVVKPGETYTTDSFFYRCVERPQNGITLQTIGCRSSNGSMVSIGETFRRGSFMYHCHEEDDTVRITGAGCIGQTGRTYGIGEPWPYQNYYFECQKNEHGIILYKKVGCADDDGNRIEAGQKFVHGLGVYLCTKEERDFSFKLAGCYAKHHRSHDFKYCAFGDRWLEKGKSKWGFIKECMLNGTGVVRKSVECVYNETIHLKPGCAKPIEQKVLTCKRNAKGNLIARLQEVPKNTTVEKFIEELDLEPCRDEPERQSMATVRLDELPTIAHVLPSITLRPIKAILENFKKTPQAISEGG